MRASSVVDVFLEPHPRLVDPDDRHLARLVTGVLLVHTLVAAVGLTILGLLWWHLDAHSIFEDLDTWGIVAVVFAQLAGAATVRAGWLRQGLWLYLVPAATLGVASAFVPDAEAEVGLIATSMFPIVIATSTLGSRAGGLLGLGTVALGVILLALVPEPSRLLYTAVVLTISTATTTVLLVLFRRHHRAREAERLTRLRQSEARYRGLLENAGEGIFVVRDGRFHFTNPTLLEMFGYAEEHLTGSHFADILHPDDAPRLAALHSSDLPQGHILRDLEFRVRAGDGTFRDVNMRTVRITWDDAPAGLCFVADVTEQRREAAERASLEAQLHHAQKMEAAGRLAGGVAHDFNNMLGAITGMAELALEDTDPRSATHGDLEEILAIAGRSAELTRQLLAFARRQPIAPRHLDLNEAITALLRMLRRIMGEGVALEWRPSPEPCPVEIDPSQLDQTLANLCVNARDAVEGDGRVVISTRPAGDRVEITVADNGCGMDEETRSRIFEPFFTTKGVGAGTGLGLATVYSIIQQNQGTIDIETAPGQGTQFTISLPRGVPVTADDGTRDTRRSDSGNSVVLVVEDEPLMLDVTRRILASLGYRVQAAAGPVEALRLAKPGTRWDLLLTDVVMPVMDGKELARRLVEIHGPLPVLFMSGYSAEIIANHRIHTERVHFLSKPFRRDQLGESVRAALAAGSVHPQHMTPSPAEARSRVA